MIQGMFYSFPVMIMLLKIHIFLSHVFQEKIKFLHLCPSAQTLAFIIRNNNIFVLSDTLHCSACDVGKSCKLPFQTSVSVYKSPLELVEMDIGGPTPMTCNDCLYYLSIVNVHTQYFWIYYLQKKSDATKIFLQFHKVVETQIGCSLNAIQDDGGGEFKTLAPYLSQSGISQTYMSLHLRAE